MRRWAIVGGFLLGALALLALAVRLRYGGGRTGFPDRTTVPKLAAATLETVATLDYPPGNVAVSADGRVFLTLHPEGRPPLKVVELRDGRPVPYPSDAFQRPREGEPWFDSVLSLRIDRQGRLWTLDNATHGLGQPRLLAFDLATGAVVHRFDVPRALAPRGSHLNDFQVDAEGRRLFIADASIMRLAPALIVYDTVAGRARRVLEGHASVQPGPWIPVVQGRTMRIFGLFAIRPGVDSIALDRSGQRLSFASVTADRLWRANVADLVDESLAADALARRVEPVAPKPMSDGLSTDDEGGLYVTDPEHSAVLRLASDGTLATLVKDERLRWPDGLSFGPDGWLYVTCSALHQVIGRTAAQVRAAGPYHVYRFRPGYHAPAGQ